MHSRRKRPQKMLPIVWLQISATQISLKQVVQPNAYWDTHIVGDLIRPCWQEIILGLGLGAKQTSALSWTPLLFKPVTILSSWMHGSKNRTWKCQSLKSPENLVFAAVCGVLKGANAQIFWWKHRLPICGSNDDNRASVLDSIHQSQHCGYNWCINLIWAAFPGASCWQKPINLIQKYYRWC